jgi:hypothetical protein
VVRQSSTFSYHLVKDQMMKCERTGATFVCSEVGQAKVVDSQLNVMTPSSPSAASGPAKMVATPGAVEVVASQPAVKVAAPAAKLLVAATDQGHTEHDDNHDFTEALHKALSEQANDESNQSSGEELVDAAAVKLLPSSK